MDGIERLLEDLNRIKAACQEMEQKKIRVGIVGGKADSDIMAIAHAHEYGATIKPKKGKYLAIPLTKQAEAAGSPRAFSDLRFVNAKNGNLLMVRDKKKRGGKTESEAMYLLVESVTLPERSFIRASFDAQQEELGGIVTGAMVKMLDGTITPAAAAESIGAQAAQLAQSFIDQNRVTPKSKSSRKTQHTTLYESGTHIRDRIAYEVVIK
ncbi:MAG: hypothetical protein HFF18_04335 [Oscillospiraceae bacterium]|nr:hypothetical protein [Oscillospiraceae bacterium]